MTKKNTPKRVYTPRALVLQTVDLPANKKELIQLPTPPEFIRTREGKGGKKFTYVEGGYVIARLNQIFSPVGWEFEIIDEKDEQKEVIVKGKLTIKDLKSGYQVSKTQYGMHEKQPNITLGANLKSAATDCLKKCASMFGIALDLYWQQIDEEGLAGKKKEEVKPPKKQTQKELMDITKSKIKVEKDPFILMEYKEKIKQSEKVYTEKEKEELYKLIDNLAKKNAQKE